MSPVSDNAALPLDKTRVFVADSRQRTLVEDRAKPSIALASFPGYRWVELGAVFADGSQRILLVHSEKNFLQEKKALESRIDKERRALSSSLFLPGGCSEKLAGAL